MVGLDEWVGTSSGLGMRLGEARQWAGFYFILFYFIAVMRIGRKDVDLLR